MTEAIKQVKYNTLLHPGNPPPFGWLLIQITYNIWINSTDSNHLQQFESIQQIRITWNDLNWFSVMTEATKQVKYNTLLHPGNPPPLGDYWFKSLITFESIQLIQITCNNLNWFNWLESLVMIWIDSKWWLKPRNK